MFSIFLLSYFISNLKNNKRKDIRKEIILKKNIKRQKTVKVTLQEKKTEKQNINSMKTSNPIEY